jgi:hypothetical protein
MAGPRRAFGTATFLRELVRTWLRENRLLLTLVVGLSLAVASFPLWRGDGTSEGIFGAFLYLPFLIALSLTAGIVSDDRATGLVDLWFQRPEPLLRFYTRRVALFSLPLLGLCVVLTAIEIGVGLSEGLLSAKQAAGVAFVMPMLLLIGIAMVFALSAWDIRRDSATALLIAMVSVFLAAAFAFDRSAASRVVSFLAFPVDPVGALVEQNGVLALTEAIGRILAYLIAWLGIAVIGLARLERRITQGR